MKAGKVAIAGFGFWRALGLLACALALLQPALSFAADWDIDQLMQTLAKAKPGRANFVERKFMAILERPIESSGELLYTAPDRLEKRTLRPKAESMVVDGNVMVIERGKRKHTLQLSDYPELTGFIDSVRGTLAGDRKALERSYKLKLDGSSENWTLVLTPSDARMANMVQQIRIAGKRDNVSSIDVIQTDGDHSLMHIERIAAQ
ncbi:outer membrane lipoprotein carrier protein LolA [soil metagenome]